MAGTIKALLDVEIIMHRTFAAAGDRAYVPEIISDCIKTCWEWRGFAGNAEPVLCFSGRNNFRKAIAPTYKAHRSPKPEGYEQVQQALKDHFPHFCFQGLEADDVMGILQTSPKFGQTAIVSIDKDMKTIPGYLINPDHILEARVIDEEEADLNWMRQAIIGDTADGFKGCPRVGPKGAAKINNWDEYFQLFEDKGHDRDYAILQARLARILRRDDYDAKAGTIKLWHPEEPEIYTLGEENG